MSGARSFRVEKVSLTVPAVLPYGAQTKDITWQHHSEPSVLTFKADSDFVTLELKGAGTAYHRVIASKINKKSGNNPVISHDSNKIMIRYDWPAIQRSEIPTQERIQLRLVNSSDMDTVVALLNPHFDLSRVNRGKPMQVRTITQAPQDRSLDSEESQTKRQRMDDIVETQPRFRMIESEEQVEEGLTRKCSVRPPLAESQVRKSTYPQETDDPPSESTVRASRTAMNSTRPPWLSEPEGNESSTEKGLERSAFPPPPHSDLDGVPNYESLKPTPKISHTTLIDLGSPDEARPERDLTDLDKLQSDMADSLIDLQKNAGGQRLKREAQLVDRFPPIRPASHAMPTVFAGGVAMTPNPMLTNSFLSGGSHHCPSVAPAAPLYHDGPVLSTGTIMPPGKGVYDLTDEELEVQVGNILHEKGFVSLVHQVSALLNKRQAIRDLQHYRPAASRVQVSHSHTSLTESAASQQSSMYAYNSMEVQDQRWFQQQESQNAHEVRPEQEALGGTDQAQGWQYRPWYPAPHPAGYEADPFEAQMKSL